MELHTLLKKNDVFFFFSFDQYATWFEEKLYFCGYINLWMNILQKKIKINITSRAGTPSSPLVFCQLLVAQS
jgi:hypothetical protein